jgi:hypothetical protein
MAGGWTPVLIMRAASYVFIDFISVLFNMWYSEVQICLFCVF